MLSSTTLVQKVAARRAQSALWCRACGGEGKLIAGLCSRCYSRRHWDKHYFAGLRAQVLDRDGHACQLCTRPEASGRSSSIIGAREFRKQHFSSRSVRPAMPGSIAPAF
jgi:hypothetical protein